MSELKRTEKRVEPAKEVDVVVEDVIVCDLCGAKDSGHDSMCETNWTGDKYTIDAVHIDHMEGAAFPEDVSYEKTIFDVCSRCFRSTIVPFLISKGAKARIEKS